MMRLSVRYAKRMADSNASQAGRELIRHRWGNARPERLAEELLPRVGELYPDTRAKMFRALDESAWDASQTTGGLIDE